MTTAPTTGAMDVNYVANIITNEPSLRINMLHTSPRVTASWAVTGTFDDLPLWDIVKKVAIKTQMTFTHFGTEDLIHTGSYRFALINTDGVAVNTIQKSNPSFSYFGQTIVQNDVWFNFTYTEGSSGITINKIRYSSSQWWDVFVECQVDQILFEGNFPYISNWLKKGETEDITSPQFFSAEMGAFTTNQLILEFAETSNQLTIDLEEDWTIDNFFSISHIFQREGFYNYWYQSTDIFGNKFVTPQYTVFMTVFEFPATSYLNIRTFEYRDIPEELFFIYLGESESEPLFDFRDQFGNWEALGNAVFGFGYERILFNVSNGGIKSDFSHIEEGRQYFIENVSLIFDIKTKFDNLVIIINPTPYHYDYLLQIPEEYRGGDWVQIEIPFYFFQAFAGSNSFMGEIGFFADYGYFELANIKLSRNAFSNLKIGYSPNEYTTNETEQLDTIITEFNPFSNNNSQSSIPIWNNYSTALNQILNLNQDLQNLSQLQDFDTNLTSVADNWFNYTDWFNQSYNSLSAEIINESQTVNQSDIFSSFPIWTNQTQTLNDTLDITNDITNTSQLLTRNETEISVWDWNNFSQSIEETDIQDNRQNLSIIQNFNLTGISDDVTESHSFTETNFNTPLQSFNVVTVANDYIEIEQTDVHLATYSFTGQSLGINPSNWIISETTSAFVNVFGALGGHNDILQFQDGSVNEFVEMQQDITPQTQGNIEFWFWTVPTGNNDYYYFTLFDGGNDGTIAIEISIELDTTTGTLHFDGTTQTFTHYQWNHLRVEFDCGTDTFNVYLNKVQVGTNEPFTTAVVDIDNVEFQSDSSDTGLYSMFVDAIDYSWTYTTYIPYRNYDYSYFDFGFYDSNIFDFGIADFHYYKYFNFSSQFELGNNSISVSYRYSPDGIDWSGWNSIIDVTQNFTLNINRERFFSFRIFLNSLNFISTPQFSEINFFYDLIFSSGFFLDNTTTYFANSSFIPKTNIEQLSVNINSDLVGSMILSFWNFSSLTFEIVAEGFTNLLNFPLSTDYYNSTNLIFQINSSNSPIVFTTDISIRIDYFLFFNDSNILSYILEPSSYYFFNNITINYTAQEPISQDVFIFYRTSPNSTFGQWIPLKTNSSIYPYNYTTNSTNVNIQPFGEFIIPDDFKNGRQIELWDVNVKEEAWFFAKINLNETPDYPETMYLWLEYITAYSSSFRTNPSVYIYNCVNQTYDFLYNATTTLSHPEDSPIPIINPYRYINQTTKDVEILIKSGNDNSSTYPDFFYQLIIEHIEIIQDSNRNLSIETRGNQYLQFRFDLNTTNTFTTPLLNDFQFTFEYQNATNWVVRTDSNFNLSFVDINFVYEINYNHYINLTNYTVYFLNVETQLFDEFFVTTNIFNFQLNETYFNETNIFVRVIKDDLANVSIDLKVNFSSSIDITYFEVQNTSLNFYYDLGYSNVFNFNSLFLNYSLNENNYLNRFIDGEVLDDFNNWTLQAGRYDRWTALRGQYEEGGEFIEPIEENGYTLFNLKQQGLFGKFVYWSNFLGGYDYWGIGKEYGAVIKAENISEDLFIFSLQRNERFSLNISSIIIGFLITENEGNPELTVNIARDPLNIYGQLYWDQQVTTLSVNLYDWNFYSMKIEDDFNISFYVNGEYDQSLISPFNLSWYADDSFDSLQAHFNLVFQNLFYPTINWSIPSPIIKLDSIWELTSSLPLLETIIPTKMIFRYRTSLDNSTWGAWSNPYTYSQIIDQTIYNIHYLQIKIDLNTTDPFTKVDFYNFTLNYNSSNITNYISNNIIEYNFNFIDPDFLQQIEYNLNINISEYIIGFYNFSSLKFDYTLFNSNISLNLSKNYFDGKVIVSLINITSYPEFFVNISTDISINYFAYQNTSYYFYYNLPKNSEETYYDFKRIVLNYDFGYNPILNGTPVDNFNDEWLNISRGSLFSPINRESLWTGTIGYISESDQIAQIHQYLPIEENGYVSLYGKGMGLSSKFLHYFYNPVNYWELGKKWGVIAKAETFTEDYFIFQLSHIDFGTLPSLNIGFLITEVAGVPTITYNIVRDILNIRGQYYWNQELSTIPLNPFSWNMYSMEILNDTALAFYINGIYDKTLVAPFNLTYYADNTQENNPRYNLDFNTLDQTLTSFNWSIPPMEFLVDSVWDLNSHNSYHYPYIPTDFTIYIRSSTDIVLGELGKNIVFQNPFPLQQPLINITNSELILIPQIHLIPPLLKILICKFMSKNFILFQ